MRDVFFLDGNNYCHVQAGVVVKFLKATCFESQINSSTRSESKEALESRAKQSIDFLEAQRNHVVLLTPTIKALSASGSCSEIVSAADSAHHPALQSSAHPTSTSAYIPAAKSPSSLTTAIGASGALGRRCRSYKCLCSVCWCMVSRCSVDIRCKWSGLLTRRPNCLSSFRSSRV